jgi:hypothetical protein
VAVVGVLLLALIALLVLAVVILHTVEVGFSLQLVFGHARSC